MSVGIPAELLRAAGIALICTVCISLLGRSGGALGFAVRVGGGILIFGMLVSSVGSAMLSLGNVVESVGGLAEEAFLLMAKALGIAFVSKLCADACRDSGESALADGVEGVGRMGIVGLCLPMALGILEYAARILE